MRLHVDWETWAHERLIDSIRLNVDHGQFGYDDWMAHSAQTYKKAQEIGVCVYVDCGLEGYYTRLEDAPAPLPIEKSAQPELYFGLMGKLVGKMLSTSVSTTSTATATRACGRRCALRTTTPEN